MKVTQDIADTAFCQSAISRFAEVFPKGAALTKKNLIKAFDNGLDIDFFIYDVLRVGGRYSIYADVTRKIRSGMDYQYFHIIFGNGEYLFPKVMEKAEALRPYYLELIDETFQALKECIRSYIEYYSEE